MDGRDLLALGVPEGKHMGMVLDQLLDSVIEESIANEKEQLLEAARSFIS